MSLLLLLDTSALLTLRDDEPGAERVEQALEQSQRCYACCLSRWVG
jgi:ribonuclease VapC